MMIIKRKLFATPLEIRKSAEQESKSRKQKKTEGR